MIFDRFQFPSITQALRGVVIISSQGLLTISWNATMSPQDSRSIYTLGLGFFWTTSLDP